MSKLTKALTAAAGNAGESLYVEDVFSTYLYDGVSSAITITNGIDLADAGGLVWTKRRATDARSHILFDSERGASSRLMTDQTAAAANQPYSITMNSDGYSWSGADNDVTIAGSTYASWTFRKAEKFFDVVTYTGTGSVQNITHNLGSVPAIIITKRLNAASAWGVYSSSLGANKSLILSGTNAALDDSISWGNTAPTDSVFTVGNNVRTGASGGTYVAYLFASDAGGFGDDETESIIKCGSVSYNGGATVDLGFEPQWVLVKTSDATGNWVINDNMRGMPNGSRGPRLDADNPNAELANATVVYPTATGFIMPSGLYDPVNLIYMAIRRPMKTPESGTEVFATAQRDTTAPIFEGGFPVDAAIIADVSGAWTNSPSMGSRLTGKSRLATSNTNAEASDPSFLWDYMNGWGDSSGSYPEYYSWMFKRATGFFDVVAGNSDASGNVWNGSHNLGVNIEFAIVKNRQSNSTQWWTAHLALGRLNILNQSSSGSSLGTDFTTTTTTFKAFSGYLENNEAFVMYAFATLAGVSKVGSYTGTGSNVDVDCGFSAGARFILIKRTDSTGDWYVWDSARGIVAGNDPYLLLNSTAAEVTSTDYIDPLSSGFTVTSSAPAALNASGGTYIFMAIS